MRRRIVIHNHIAKARDVNAFEHALSKEKEEANRDKYYKDSGIVRVLASDVRTYRANDIRSKKRKR